LSDSARKQLQAVPGIRVYTETRGDLHMVKVAELASPDPSTQPTGIHPKLWADEEDLERMAGRTMDWSNDRWRIGLELTLRAQETPNPNGRRYLTDWILHRGDPAYFTRPQAGSTLANHLLTVAGVQSVLFRDNEFTIERADDTPWKDLDKRIDETLRHALLHCAPPIQQTENSSFAPGSLEAQIQELLAAEVLPAIHRDGGDLQLLGVEDRIVKVALRGACASCPASMLTLKAGVEAKILAVFPEFIDAVEAI